MAEELTTDMHFEFLEDMGTDRLSYFVFAARGAMNRGLSKAEALKRYGLSEAVYDAEIDRVLSTDDWWGKGVAPEKKETIFDFNPTEEEIIDLCGYLVDKKEFIEEDNQNTHYATIYRLLMLRGEKDKALSYFDKIPDTLGKWFSLANHCT